MKKSRYLFVVFYLLIFLIMATGCWDSRELDDLAIVVGTGIDKDGESYQLSFEIIMPGQMQSSGSGGSGGGNPSYVLQSTGATIFDTVRKARSQSSRKLFFPHNRIIVIGEKLAEQGIYPVLDFFLRDPEPRPTEYILITEDKAGEIFETKSELEISLAKALDAQIKNQNESWVKAVNLQEINAAILNTSGAYLIPKVKIGKKDEQSMLIVDGSAALFKDDRMIGAFTDSESRGIKWVEGEVKSASVVSKLPNNGERVTAEIFLNRSSVKVFFVDGLPKVDVSVYAEGNVAEVSGSINLDDPEALQQILKSTEIAIKQEILSALRKAQSLNADAFGFGKKFSQKYPKKWEKIESSWEDSFQNLDVRINVEANLWRVGGVIRTPVR